MAGVFIGLSDRTIGRGYFDDFEPWMIREQVFRSSGSQAGSESEDNSVGIRFSDGSKIVASRTFRKSVPPKRTELPVGLDGAGTV